MCEDNRQEIKKANRILAIILESTAIDNALPLI